MALSIVSRIGASPLGRAGVAIFSILTLAGAVQFGLPLACGATEACLGDETVALDEARAALDAALGDGPPAVVAEAADPAGDTGDTVEPAPIPGPSPQGGPVAQVPAVLTYSDLIASTFAVLDGAVTAQPTALAARSVKTVTINADGTPMRMAAADEPAAGGAEAPAPLVAAASAEPVATPDEPADASPTPNSSPQGGGGQERSVERTSSLAYAPASGDVASVTGKGANVRSLPRKGGSEVLFALRGGEEVTIVEMQKGWAKVVDSQGRSGWIYGEYLER